MLPKSLHGPVHLRVLMRVRLKQRCDGFSGRPSAEDVDAIASPFAATMLEALPGGDLRELHKLFPSASPDAADLLSKCAPSLFERVWSCRVKTNRAQRAGSS